MEEFKPVPTRASLALQKKNQNTEFKALVFEEPRALDDKSNNDAKPSGAPSQDGRKKEFVFDIKKTRTEILNFAMDNQRTIKNQKRMRIFQAVKLGAKPPKKKCKNYKELKDERARLKQIREERKKFHQLGKNQAGAASVKCRTKSKIEKQQKKRAPVTAITQNYGVVKPKLKKKK